MNMFFKTIFLLVLFTPIVTTVLLDGAQPRSTLKQVTNACTHLSAAINRGDLVEQFEQNFNYPPTQNPLYKDMQQKWTKTIVQALKTILSCKPEDVAGIVSAYASPHWWETEPYKLYNYFHPYTPDITKILGPKLIDSRTYEQCWEHSDSASENPRANTPESWEEFLNIHRPLYLQFIEASKSKHQKHVHFLGNCRELTLFDHQKKLIGIQEEKNVLAFLTIMAASLGAALAPTKWTQKIPRVLKELGFSLCRSTIIERIIELSYHKYQLQSHELLKWNIVPRPLDSPWNPHEFPAFHLLDARTFISIYTLLDLLHTYGLVYKNTVIESERWVSTTQLIEQWLRSKISNYTRRKKKATRIAQKLKLPLLFSKLPFIIKLGIAISTSRTYIDIEPLKSTAA